MTNETTKNKYLVDLYNPIHFVKRYLIRREIEKISMTNPINQIADLGCGLGIISKELSKYAKVDAYDANQKAISFAKRTQQLKDLKFYAKNILNIKENTYDIAVCSEVLQYIPNDLGTLKKIYRILKSHGFLTLTVPFNKNLVTAFDKRERSRRYSLNEIVNKMKAANFEIRKIRYWGYPLLKIFYSCIYIPQSNNEATKKARTYKYPKIILMLLKYLRYLFLLDLLFNSEESFGILLVGQKKQ